MQPNNFHDRRGFPSYWAADTGGSAKRSRSEDAEEESSHDSGVSPWRAMKRLRVGEGAFHSHSGPAVHHPPPPQTLFPQPPAKQPSPELRRTISDTQDLSNSSYAGVNSLLGSLHAARLRREKQREQQMAAPPPVPSYSYSQHPGQASSPMDMSPIRERPTPQRRPRKVVHLHTDSKLR